MTHIVLFELGICITCACLFDFAFIAIMTSQYWACPRGDHKSSCIYDRHVRKEKIAGKVKLVDKKFNGYYNSSVFYNWLAVLSATLICMGFLMLLESYLLGQNL